MKRSDDKSCNCGNQVFGKTNSFFMVKVPLASPFSHSIDRVLTMNIITDDHLIVSCTTLH